MEDSEVNIPGQLEAPKVPAITEEIVMLPDGKARKVIRGDKGKFQKQKKTAPETKEIVRYMRELLNKAEAGPDGKIVKGSKTRFRRMFDNIFDIASMSPETLAFDKKGSIIWDTPPVEDENGKIIIPGKPLLVRDAKLAMAATQAFKELMLRAHGMPSKSDEELDALKKEGVKIVVIAPPEMVNKEIVAETTREKLVPSFIDAEIIENR